MTPRPPLLDTAEARGAVEVWAMPARRMGWVMERRVVRGVVRVGLGEDIVARAVLCMSRRKKGIGMDKGERLFFCLVNELESLRLCCCSATAERSRLGAKVGEPRSNRRHGFVCRRGHNAA